MDAAKGTGGKATNNRNRKKQQQQKETGPIHTTSSTLKEQKKKSEVLLKSERPGNSNDDVDTDQNTKITETNGQQSNHIRRPVDCLKYDQVFASLMEMGYEEVVINQVLQKYNGSEKTTDVVLTECLDILLRCPDVECCFYPFIHFFLLHLKYMKGYMFVVDVR